MLDGGFREGGQYEIEVQDARPYIVEQLVQFIKINRCELLRPWFQSSSEDTDKTAEGGCGMKWPDVVDVIDLFNLLSRVSSIPAQKSLKERYQIAPPCW